MSIVKIFSRRKILTSIIQIFGATSLAILFDRKGLARVSVPRHTTNNPDHLISQTPPSPPPISTKDYQAMLKTGMDVDWAKTNPGRKFAQKAHDQKINVPEMFKERGLQHVRIRIRDDVRDQSLHPDTKKALLDEIAILVDDCLAADLIPIIAYQAANFKEDPTSDTAMAEVGDWWETVAKRFKRYSYKLSYNLIIETTEEIKKHNDRLNLCYKQVTEKIRNIDPYRICIVAPNKISDPYELKNLVVPTPTEYMMVEWHFYAAGPSNADDSKKKWTCNTSIKGSLTCGTNAEKDLITDKINVAKQWSEDNDIPTWVGAWMANNYKQDAGSSVTLEDGAPGGGDYSPEKQLFFARFMSRKLQEAKIPYAVNSDTKFFNRETNQWYESMSKVLKVMIKQYTT